MSTSPTPPPSWKEKIQGFASEHWGKVLAWIFGGSSTKLDQWWIKIVPIPGDLQTLGLLWAVLLSALTLAVVGYSYSERRRMGLPKNQMQLAMLWLSGRWAVAVFIGLAGFFGIEWLWKKLPVGWVDVVYFGVEPIIYASIFASLAAFLLAICYYFYEFLWP